MKKIAYLACFLAVISAIAGGTLAAVNSLTAPIIEEMGISAEKANLELIFPGAAFKEVEYTDESGLVKGVYEAEGKGYIFKIETFGYSSTPVMFLLAFDAEGKTVGFKALSHQETSGFGARVFEEDYTNQVLSKSSADSYDLLSGATVTSTAVVKGINAAKVIFNAMKGIETTEADTEIKAPTLALGNPVSFDADYASNAAVVEDKGNGLYSVEVKGYGLLEGDPEHGTYTINVVEVQVDLVTRTIASVELVSFGDTKGIGDKTVNEEYYALFKGLSVDDLKQEVDTVTGATITSKSIIAAVQAVMQQLGK